METGGLEFLFKYPNSHITNWVWSTFPGNPSTEWGVDRSIAGLSLASSLVLEESDRGLHLLPSSGACTSTHTHHIHAAIHTCAHILFIQKNFKSHLNLFFPGYKNYFFFFDKAITNRVEMKF